jgi:hypothetical protein
MGYATTRNRRLGYYGGRKDINRTGRREGTSFKQPLVNRICFLIDASSSMDGRKAAVVKVIQNQVDYLARRSQELGQETRVSVASFADAMAWLVFDVDVLRLPSIADLFNPYGNTALIEATIRSQADLATIPELAGDYSYLTYVITDGMENVSELEDGSRATGSDMQAMFSAQKDNWTIAALVPHIVAKREAINYGFPKDNVAVWDTTKVNMDEVDETITAATESYLTGRASGVRGSRSVFSTGADAVNTATVKAALVPLAMDKYSLIPVMPEGVQKGDKVRVDKFIREDCGMTFRLGTVYYEWSKRETVQPQKRLAVVQKSTGKVFVGTGDEVRQMIGLPSLSVREAPKANPDYTVFVQSTAPNRNLVPFTKVLVMLP